MNHSTSEDSNPQVAAQLLPNEQASGRMPTVGVQRLPHAEGLPVLGTLTPGSSGYDLSAAIDEPRTVEPGRLIMVPTGHCLEIPIGYEAQVRPRSGLAAKHQVGVLNSPGTIDSDYRGEIQVLVYNFGTEPYRIERGDRVAQLVFARVHHPVLELRDLTATERAAGGFGSTGRR